MLTYLTANPELSLHIHCHADGVHVEARLYVPDGDGGRRLGTIAETGFRPSAVTEIGVVDGGQRCRSAWLARQLEAE
mgnify:CR=1 FL=1